MRRERQARERMGRTWAFKVGRTVFDTHDVF